MRAGSEVQIVQKQHQRTGRLTRGIVRDVRDVLTKSPTHPHGIKVRLETGEVGRVKEIVSGERGIHSLDAVITAMLLY